MGLMTQTLFSHIDSIPLIAKENLFPKRIAFLGYVLCVFLLPNRKSLGFPAKLDVIVE